MRNLHSVTKFSNQNLSYPGCWAYPDMLEVGCQHGPGGADDPGLTMVESRTHFGAWAIVSSPLTLSHDVNNDTIMDEIWPIIANKEAIAVSQVYAGFSGGPFQSSVTPSGQYFYKPLDHDMSTAVLLINDGSSAQQLALSFADVPGIKDSCRVRDIWAHEDLGA